MRVRFIFVLALFYSTHSWADSFKIAGKIIQFTRQDGLLLKGCEQNKCMALDHVRKHSKIDLKKIRKNVKFVGSVGSDVCRWVYQGQSLIGIAENRDQRAFCMFKDQSMIETNSLGDYLVSKKIVNTH